MSKLTMAPAASPLRPYLLLLVVTISLALTADTFRALAEPDNARMLTSFELTVQHVRNLPHHERNHVHAHRRRLKETSRRHLRLIGSGGMHGNNADLRIRHRRRLQATSLVTGVTAPPLVSGPSMASVNTTYYRWESVSPPAAVDWRTTPAITPIVEQYMCASCWSIAAVDSIAMMWAIARNTLPTPLSPQQVCDCATKQCCNSGWPDWAYSYVLFNGGLTSSGEYPYVADDSTTCFFNSTLMPVAAQITGWELVPTNSPVALMKAVSMQPVVAFLDASSKNFAKYKSRGFVSIFNGNCSTEINHAVVVVGFKYDPADLPGSYWIVKNSWYKPWGDRGYMYLSMIADTRGKCGIHSAPAMYPVFYPAGPQPARFASDRRGKWKIGKVDDVTSTFATYTLTSTTTTFTTTTTVSTTTTSTSPTSDSFMLASTTDATATDSSLSAGSTTGSLTAPIDPCVGVINPCGGGRCNGSTGVARCDCSSLPDMVEMIGMPTSKCVPRFPCARGVVNPCGGGNCTDVGDGTYTCSCRTGYAMATTVDAAPTCLPSAGVSKSYVTVPGDNCQSVSTANNISTAALTALNPFLNCTEVQYVPPGVTLLTSFSSSSSTANTTYCTSTYNVRGSDTCSSIANRFFGGALSTLLSFNPTINCTRLFVRQPLCVRQAVASSASSAPLCGQSVVSELGDTCASMAVKFNVSRANFDMLNPGLNCSSIIPPGTAACVANRTAVMLSDVNCTRWYRVMQGDSCPTIWNAANLSMSQFLAINPGIICQAPFLAVGQQACIDSPILDTMSLVNLTYYRYTVQPGDTLAYISSLYVRKCTSSSVSPFEIAALNNIANVTAPLATAGRNLTIPCAGRAGIIDCSCSESLLTCGADFTTYPSYCDAECNYAAPVILRNTPCSPCHIGCEGRTGLAPRAGYCPSSVTVCPYPTWWNNATESSDPSICSTYIGQPSGNCCEYMDQSCGTNCWDTVNTLGGTNSTRTTNFNACFNNCMCSARIPCGATNCPAPSSCWSMSPRRCEYINMKYVYTVALNPGVSPLP